MDDETPEQVKAACAAEEESAMQALEEQGAQLEAAEIAKIQGRPEDLPPNVIDLELKRALASLVSVAKEHYKIGLRGEELAAALFRFNESLKVQVDDDDIINILRFAEMGLLPNSLKRSPSKPKSPKPPESKFITDKLGHPKAMLYNYLVWCEERTQKGMDLKWDTFSNEILYCGKRLTKEGQHSLTAIRGMIEESIGKASATRDIEVAIKQTAMLFGSFDSLTDYLERCHQQWDGKDRIDRLLGDVFELDQTDLLGAFSSRFFIQAAARGLSPGCKAECVLILSGQQGERGRTKSSFVQSLVPNHDWCSDSLRIDPTDKYNGVGLVSKWIVEIAENAPFLRSSSEDMKKFLSTQHDDVMLKFENQVTRFDRRCVFVATTNEDKPLHDPTGGRRFWIVHIPSGVSINLDYLNECRDHLWGEAVHRFKQGEKWWFDEADGDLLDLVNSSQKDAFNPDESENLLSYFLSLWGERGPFTMRDIADILVEPRFNTDKSLQTRMGFALRRAGFIRRRIQEGSLRFYKFFSAQEIVPYI